MTEIEQRALYIGRQCRKAGMTMAGAAGVLINVQYESAFSPINVEDRYHADTGKSDAYYTQVVDTNPSYDFATDHGKAYGYGICQWTLASRKIELRKICRQKGVSIGDLQTQVDFLLLELKRDFPKVWGVLTSSSNVYDCAWQICRWFENPANADAKAAYRGGQAQAWLNFLLQHIDDESSDPDPSPAPAPQPEPETDDDGMPIEKTWPPRTIDGNCSGWPEVKLLQAILRCRGYNVTVDGIWSETLAEKVRDFQSAAALTADGVVGPMSWEKLMVMERG